MPGKPIVPPLSHPSSPLYYECFGKALASITHMQHQSMSSDILGARCKQAGYEPQLRTSSAHAPRASKEHPTRFGGYPLALEHSTRTRMAPKGLTWIPVQLAEEEVVREGTQLLDSDQCNILGAQSLPLLLQFIVQLYKHGDTEILNLVGAFKRAYRTSSSSISRCSGNGSGRSGNRLWVDRTKDTPFVPHDTIAGAQHNRTRTSCKTDSVQVVQIGNLGRAFTAAQHKSRQCTSQPSQAIPSLS